MSILVTVEVAAKAGSFDAMKKMFMATLTDTAQFDGCHGVIAHTDQNKANTVMMVGDWESRAHYEKYIAWRAETESMEVLQALAAGPPIIRYFDRLEESTSAA